MKNSQHYIPDCGFVRVASTPANTYLLYTPPSYEIRNESDPSASSSIELSVYKKDPEGCVDFDSYSCKFIYIFSAAGRQGLAL